MKKNLLLKYFIFVITFFVLLTDAYAAERKKVAVLNFVPNNVPASYAAVVRDIVEVHLYKTNAFDILERSRIDAILAEQGFNQTGCSDTGCAVKLGQMLSVDMIVIGSVNRLTRFTITLKYVDVRKGSVEYADCEIARVEGAIEEAIDLLAVRSARIIINSGTKVDSPEEPVKINNPGNKKSLSSKSYGFTTLSFTGISAVGFGLCYLFNVKVGDINSEYNILKTNYNLSTDYDEATQLHDEMEDKKKDSQKYALYRNISLGAGGIFALTTLWFTYKYCSSKSIRKKMNDQYGRVSLYFGPYCLQDSPGTRANKGFVMENYTLSAVVSYRF